MSALLPGKVVASALALTMLAHSELLAHITADFSQEEFPAKCLLVQQGLRAKKLFYIETGGGAAGLPPTRAKK
jgi:hypothetical protein